jgi:hypothetical protein
MAHPKFFVVLSTMAFLVMSCASQLFVIESPEDRLTTNPLPTATVIPASIPPSNTVSISEQTPWVISSESCAVANEPLPQIPTPETPYAGVDVRGLLNKPLGGGVAQNGEFTIEFVLYCDDSFGSSSMEPYFASDINHLAVFVNWRYDGIVENAPTYIIQGVEPNLHGYALSTQEPALNGGFGISSGLFGPFPDFSNKTMLRFVYIAFFPSGEFSGAVLSFDLQQVSDGLQASNVFVAPLSNSTAPVKP